MADAINERQSRCHVQSTCTVWHSPADPLEDPGRPHRPCPERRLVPGWLRTGIYRWWRLWATKGTLLKTRGGHSGSLDGRSLVSVGLEGVRRRWGPTGSPEAGAPSARAADLLVLRHGAPRVVFRCCHPFPASRSTLQRTARIGSGVASYRWQSVCKCGPGSSSVGAEDTGRGRKAGKGVSHPPNCS